MKNTKNFFLNGDKFFTNQSISLIDIIKYFKYNSSLLILEYNYSICSKENWKKIYINNDDKIEIITIVGGG